MIPFKEQMTLEEAFSFEGNRVIPDTWDENKFISFALSNYNFYVKWYNRYKEKIAEGLKETATEPMEDIRIESFEKYILRKSSGAPKFTAWSENYVYVMGRYDGHEWVEKIARNPSDELSKAIGGG